VPNPESARAPVIVPDPEPASEESKIESVDHLNLNYLEEIKEVESVPHILEPTSVETLRAINEGLRRFNNADSNFWRQFPQIPDKIKRTLSDRATKEREEAVDDQMNDGTLDMGEDAEDDRILCVDNNMMTLVSLNETMRGAGFHLNKVLFRNSIDAAIEIFLQNRRAIKLFIIGLRLLQQYAEQQGKPLSFFVERIREINPD
jgi:hypothetical protein